MNLCGDQQVLWPEAECIDIYCQLPEGHGGKHDDLDGWEWEDLDEVTPYRERHLLTPIKAGSARIGWALVNINTETPQVEVRGFLDTLEPGLTTVEGLSIDGQDLSPALRTWQGKNINHI